MNLFLVNKDNPHAESLIKNITNQLNGGRIVAMSQEEVDLYCSDDFKIVSFGNEGNSNVVEINPEKSYVWTVEEGKENIDDILMVREQLGANIGIVRCRR